MLSRAFTITTEARRAAGVEASETVPSGAGDVSWDPREDVDELAAKERQAAAMKDIQETLATLPEEVVISVTEERQMASNRKEEVARKLEFLEQEEELIEEEIAERKLEEDAARAREEKAAAEKEAAAPEMAFDVHARKRETTGATAGTRRQSFRPPPLGAARRPAAPKPTYESIDSVSLDEVESVVAGRRAKRAAKLSRLLAALAGVSSLSVERKELMLLVRKELSSYGKRLRQVQVQLEGLDGDAAVAAAVAAEADLSAATAIEAHAARGGELLRARAEEACRRERGGAIGGRERTRAGLEPIELGAAARSVEAANPARRMTRGCRIRLRWWTTSPPRVTRTTSRNPVGSAPTTTRSCAIA